MRSNPSRFAPSGAAFRTILVTSGLLVSASALSCSFALDFDKVQCTRDADCTKLGSEFKHGQCTDAGLCEPGPECKKDEECEDTEACIKGSCTDRWACLDEDVSPATQAVTLTIPVATIFGDPLPGQAIKLCNVVDTDCTAPIDELVTDEAGLLTVTMPPTLVGYLETNRPGFFPQLNFLPTVLTEPTLTAPISLSPVEIIEGLALQVGQGADPERGHIVISSASCLGPAPNLTIVAPKADGQTIAYYVQNGVPAPDLNVTATDGAGGFLNFITGTGAIELRTTGGDKVFSRNIFVRKGTITAVHFQPEALSLASVQPGENE